MKVFCESFNHWLYHPLDTRLICENRIKLSIPECLRCKGITSVNKKEKSRSPFYCKKYNLKISQCSRHPELNGGVCNECIQSKYLQEIYLNLDKDQWVNQVKWAVEEYNIQIGEKKDEISARRIANLLGEIYIKLSAEPTQVKLLRVMIVEKDMFDLAMELKLECNPLESEERVKPHLRKKVLCTWGIDKTSGLERYTSQLKEWTIEALKINQPLAEDFQSKEETKYGREIDLGAGTHEGFELEEIGIG